MKDRFIFNTSQQDFVGKKQFYSTKLLFTSWADLEINRKGNSKNVILQKLLIPSVILQQNNIVPL